MNVTGWREPGSEAPGFDPGQLLKLQQLQLAHLKGGTAVPASVS